MNANDYMLGQLSRQIQADRVREAQHASLVHYLLQLRHARGKRGA